MSPHRGRVLQDVRLAHLVGEVRPGQVWCQRREHDRASSRDQRGGGTRRVAEALVAERFDIRVGEGPHPMHPWCHDRAPVVLCRVGERKPDRQILLRLDVRVAVVLVPRHPSRLLRFLVDGLVPVEVDVGTEQVRAEVRQRRRGRQLPKDARPGCEVDRHRDGAGLGDRHPLVGLRSEKGLDLGLTPVDLVRDRGQRVVVDDAVHDEPTLTVELRCLRVGDPAVRRPGALPRERRVPRVRYRLPHGSRA